MMIIIIFMLLPHYTLAYGSTCNTISENADDAKPDLTVSQLTSLVLFGPGVRSHHGPFNYVEKPDFHVYFHISVSFVRL
jgi:hypothetical protein